MEVRSDRSVCTGFLHPGTHFLRPRILVPRLQEGVNVGISGVRYVYVESAITADKT